MSHPNAMTTWPEIACQRGHGEHLTRRVEVTLGGPTPYADCAPIPMRFARSFLIDVYPPERYPVDGGPYCPAHDVVSETIVSHGVWEPRESVLVLTVCASDAPGEVVDVGAQIGWFSLLAMSCGRDVSAWEADAANAAALRASAEANGWRQQLVVHEERITADSPRQSLHMPIRLVKIDVEGAERDAVRIIWPSIEAGLVDHLMMEVSPVFDDYYPDLVARLVDVGYRAFLLPPKHSPPIRLDDPEHDLAPYRIDQRADLRELVASWHQEDVWLQREGASW